MAYIDLMATKLSTPVHKIADADTVAERGHADWKRAKVEQGLAQAQDRSAMIPSEKVWRDLGLES